LAASLPNCVAWSVVNGQICVSALITVPPGHVKATKLGLDEELASVGALTLGDVPPEQELSKKQILITRMDLDFIVWVLTLLN
jgi:ethanolamine utilization microcompartment shell protein EutS